MNPGSKKILGILCLLAPLWVEALPAEGNRHPARPSVDSPLSLGAPDGFEEDDHPSQARIITLNDPEAQAHNFHAPGDEDWVRFYGIAGEHYVIKTEYLEAGCDTVITLFDSNGATEIDSVDDYGNGKSELLSWQCLKNGIYYVKIRHYSRDAHGDGASYQLRVYRPDAPVQAIFTGVITNGCTTAPISEAILETSGFNSAISTPDGGFKMFHEAGDYAVIVTAPGFTRYTARVTLPESHEVNQIIALSPVQQPGDVDGNGSIEVTDAVLALRVLLGLNHEGVGSGGSIHGNSKVGGAEAIYILQKVSRLR